VLGEGGQVYDLPLFVVLLHPPYLASQHARSIERVAYPDGVITASGRQSTGAMGSEVGGVDGGVLLVPLHEQGRSLHVQP